MPVSAARPATCLAARLGIRGVRWLVPLGIATLAFALAGGPASARGRDDHDRARAAVQAGEVLGLRQVLERLERTHPGQVLEVELEREDGRWVYEVRLLQPAGQLVKLKLDARTAEVLQAQRRGDPP